MKRRAFLALLAGTAAGCWTAAHAQQPQDRLRRIGVLYGGAPEDPQGKAGLAIFAKSLEDLGWSSRHNIAIDYRFAVGDPERMRALSKELVGLRPDVIVAHTTPVVAALQQETRTLPIVFVVVSDPVGSGFVASLPRPGGNITGFINIEGSLGGKWIEMLKEIVPNVRRAAMMFNPDTATYSDYYWLPFEAAGRTLAVAPSALHVRTATEIERAVAQLAETPDTGLVVMPDVFTGRKENVDLIVALAAQHRVPTIYPYRYMAQAGGLVSYGIDPVDLWRRAPIYVDRILKRTAAPGDLPVQLPTKFELVVNLRTAKTLGLTISESFLLRADEVME